MDIDKLRQQFKEEAADKDNHKENSGCMFIYEDEKKNNTRFDVCHAFMQRQDRGCVTILNSFQLGVSYSAKNNRDLTPEEERRFIQWLIIDSPYESVFSCKDVDKAMADQMIQARTDVPSNLLAAGLVACRRLWEYNVVVRVMLDLVDAGMNADLAYVIAHMSNTTLERKKINWSQYDRGHCSLRPHSVHLGNFLAHKLENPNKNYYDDVYYSGYDTMYGASKGELAIVRDKFDYSEEKKVDSGLNPFIKAIRSKEDDGQSIEYWTGIKRMAAMNDHILNLVGYKKEEQREAA